MTEAEKVAAVARSANAVSRKPTKRRLATLYWAVSDILRAKEADRGG